MLTLLALLTTPSAEAADLYWGGHYTSRFTAYDSLSLGSENDRAEGLSTALDHRAQLRPTWAISPNIGLHAQLDVFYLQNWGHSPATYVDPVSGESIPVASADGIASAESSLVARALWADIYAPLGRIRFGRMPVDWGAGIVLNAGQDPNSKYGDTSDRIEFTTKVGPMYVEGAYDLISEGLLGENDDFHVANVALAWRTENVGIGYLNRYRMQPSNDFGSYLGDIWAKADFGTLSAEVEFAFELGGGDLSTGANDIDIARWGGNLQLGAQLGAIQAGVEMGVASGDEDTSDAKLKTFTFDRDHDVGILMFEETLPVLEATVMNESTGGRTLDAARTGNAVSNAQYLRPWVSYALRKDLVLTGQLLAARADKLDESESTGRGYGTEIGLSAAYTPYEKVTITPAAALFLPGAYYSEYVDDDLGGAFNGPVYGGRILATVSF